MGGCWNSRLVLLLTTRAVPSPRRGGDLWFGGGADTYTRSGSLTKPRWVTVMFSAA